MCACVANYEHPSYIGTIVVDKRPPLTRKSF